MYHLRDHSSEYAHSVFITQKLHGTVTNRFQIQNLHQKIHKIER